MPKIIFIATEEEKEAWVTAAHGELVSLSEWLRRAANQRSGGPEPGQPTPRPLPVHRADPRDRASQERAPAGKKSGEVCPHRVPIGAYCKRCEEEGSGA